jgi:PAS domain-containing protein
VAPEVAAPKREGAGLYARSGVNQRASSKLYDSGETMNEHPAQASLGLQHLAQLLANVRAQEQHLRLAQEAGEIGTWEWDIASGKMRWSAQMFRNLGLSPGRTTEQSEVLPAAVHPDDREQADAAFAAFSRRPGPLRSELRFVWPSGDIHSIVFLGKMVVDEAGTPIRMLGTARRRADAGFAHPGPRLRGPFSVDYRCSDAVP